jgi:hypothetical protein
MRKILVVIGVSLMFVVSAGISFAQTATLLPPELLGSAQSREAVTSASSGIASFTAKGTANVNLISSHGGACLGITCTAGDGCECDIINGNLTATVAGKSILLLNITTDDSARANDGNGTSGCFPGTGFGTLCNASGSCLGLQTAGKICTSTIVNPAVTTEVSFNVNEIYYIQPETGTGKFAGSSGGGNLAIAVDLQINGTTTVTKNAGYASMVGTFQQKP